LVFKRLSAWAGFYNAQVFYFFLSIITMAVKIVRRALPHSSEEIEVRLTTGVHSLTLDDGTKIRILEENVTNMTKIQDYTFQGLLSGWVSSVKGP
jgi:hypothetical protein